MVQSFVGWMPFVKPITEIIHMVLSCHHSRMMERLSLHSYCIWFPVPVPATMAKSSSQPALSTIGRTEASAHEQMTLLLTADKHYTKTSG